MKTLIAIPCMDYLEADFVECLTNLRARYGEDEVEVKFLKASLVYDARNQLTKYVIDKGCYDYVLWLDSDMTFDADLMERFSEDLEQGWDMVCGIYFKRKFPLEPVIYTKMLADPPTAEMFYDYPQDALFEVAGCGFGGVLMKTEAIAEMDEPPFDMIPGLSEDFSCCVRMARLGKKMACDSRVKFGHIGLSIYNEKLYKHPDGGG